MSSIESAVANTLRRLIARLGSSKHRNGDLSDPPADPGVSLPATKSSMPDYFRLATHGDRVEFHASMRSLERQGGVRLDWDRRAGFDGQVERIHLLDTNLVANFLQEPLSWVMAREAIERLNTVSVPAAYQGKVDAIADSWRRGAATARVTAANASRFIDALRVLNAVDHAGGADVLMRRLSIQLFKDSKRIESLSAPLSYLLNWIEENVGAEEDDVRDMFAEIGLVKYPQPMLLACPEGIEAQVASKNVPLVYPYIGLRPDSIEGLQIRSSGAVSKILTVENQATFNEIAQAAPANTLVIYTAGNPTPSWLSAYRRIVSELPGTRLLHWGDIDRGGYRIASRIASSIPADRSLALLQMTSGVHTGEFAAQAPKAHVDEVVALCRQNEWFTQAHAMEQAGLFQEQEVIPITSAVLEISDA